MAQISGKAKRFNGEPVDYVLLFDWASGNCIGKAIPNALGEWEYNHTSNLNCGITYVADGCEPITHGVYSYNVVIPTDTILHYDFNGDVLDKSAKGLDGVRTGSTAFVTGRKAGTQAIDFTDGCVRTPSFLPIGTNKLTVSFWIKTSQSALGVIYESSPDFNGANNTFAAFTNVNKSGELYATQLGSGYNTVISPLSINDVWQHVIITVDRDKLASEEQKIYINNQLVSSFSTTENADSTGDFSNQILYIGQRGATSAAFVGVLQDMRFYNRVLIADERAALFNE
ncbi:LamG domain-containing protein [Psychrobacter cryohalolentis]|uniref:LamG domain-containing protein n=1 Tax=Psychrobacter sp. D2 TaxID=2759702 RepID=UPI0015E5E7A6|nr:LamG domain-containing protein [Psychrobacter sp. D2]MBA2057322.1 LamG domain-containing protein [Psychrobacter sp. D2]